MQFGRVDEAMLLTRQAYSEDPSTAVPFPA